MALLKKYRILIIALALSAFSVTLTSLALTTINRSIYSTGTISSAGIVTYSLNIGVYSDCECTASLNSIDWGSVAAGDTSSQTVYVKNTGETSVTLSLASGSWIPFAAGTYITIGWNQQGTRLSTGQSVAAAITLTVSSTIVGITAFSNTITISGTG